MRIYRNEYKTVERGSEGFSYHTNQRVADAEAARWRRENGDDAEVEREYEDVPLNGAGIMRILFRWASHPDNG